MTLETWLLTRKGAKSDQPSCGVLALSGAHPLLPGKPSFVCPRQLHRHCASAQREADPSLSCPPACVTIGCAKNAAIPKARSPPLDDVLATSRIDARIRIRMLMVFFQENASMWKNLSITSFGQGLASTARTCWTTVKLAWKAAPLLLVGVLLLFGVESGLTPLQLALSRAVIDSLAAPVGRTAALDPLVTHVPLAVWIALTIAVVALGQLIAPLIAMLQSQAGDRLTGYVTEQVMQAANRWQGLERFEDPNFADDLQRAREAATRGVDLVYFGAIVALALLTALRLSVTLARLNPQAPLLLILAPLPQMVPAFAEDCFMGGEPDDAPN